MRVNATSLTDTTGIGGALFAATSASSVITGASATGGKPALQTTSQEMGMDDKIKRAILEIVDRHRVTSLATLRPDGWPQATTVGYVNEGLDIYFLCGCDSQKAHNLSQDDRVSLTINDDPSDVMQIKGLSLAGHASPVEDQTEAARVIALWPRKYPTVKELPMPMPPPDQIRVFCVTPSVLSLLDYSQGFGHSDLVTS